MSSEEGAKKYLGAYNIKANEPAWNEENGSDVVGDNPQSLKLPKSGILLLT